MRTSARMQNYCTFKRHNTKNHISEFGFTLLELMVVIGIIAILSGFMIPSFNTYVRNQSLRQAQQQVQTDLRALQNRALTGVQAEGNSHWGAIFDNQSTQYHFFPVADGVALDTACSTAASTLSSLETSDLLPNNIVTHDANYSCIFFSFDNGNATAIPSVVGSYTTWVGYKGGTTNDCMRIFVNGAGMITVGADIEDCN